MEVTVNASSVEDIDPSAIGQRLTNGTAALASPVLSRLRTREEEHGEVVRFIYAATRRQHSQWRNCSVTFLKTKSVLPIVQEDRPFLLS